MKARIGSERALLQGFRILVVEDQYLVATEIRRLIEGLGGTVIGPCKSNEDAIELLNSAAVDIALLDVNLDGTTAYVIADLLIGRGIPIIFATGYEPWAIDRRYHGAPHLEKPIVEGALMEAIQKLGLVGGRRSNGAGTA